MANFLVIKNGVVLDIVTKDGFFEPTDTVHDHDTITEDPSGRFNVGDAYTLEIFLQYNTPPKSIEELRIEHRASVDEARESVENQGLPYVFPGNYQDTIQLRNERDVSIINSLVSMALILKAQGVTDPVLEFRAESNKSHFLTPDQMLHMGMSVSAFVSELYRIAWRLKEQIDAATEATELPPIKWPQQ